MVFIIIIIATLYFLFLDSHSFSVTVVTSKNQNKAPEKSKLQLHLDLHTKRKKKKMALRIFIAVALICLMTLVLVISKSMINGSSNSSSAQHQDTQGMPVAASVFNIQDKLLSRFGLTADGELKDYNSWCNLQCQTRKGSQLWKGKLSTKDEIRANCYSIVCDCETPASRSSEAFSFPPHC